MYSFEEGIVKRTTNDCRAFERIPRDFHLFTNRIKVLERSVAQTFGVVVFKRLVQEKEDLFEEEHDEWRISLI